MDEVSDEEIARAKSEDPDGFKEFLKSIEINGEKNVQDVGSLVANGTKVTLDLSNGNESLEAVMDVTLKSTVQEDGIYSPLFGNSVQVKKGDIIEMSVEGNALAKIYNADVSLSPVDVTNFLH